MASPARPIALVGLSGAGKSAVASVLGLRLGGSAVDLDARIEHESGASVPALFARDGEDAFRDRELAALDQALAESPVVIACGGGIVTRAEARRRLRECCRVAWLEVGTRTAARRLADEAASRPLLAGPDGKDLESRLDTLLAERRSAYAEVAHARVETDGLTVDQTADAVLRALTRAPEGAQA